MSDQQVLAHAPDAEHEVEKAMRLSSLTPDPQNTHRHSERNLARMEQALREVGVARAVGVDEVETVRAGNAGCAPEDPTQCGTIRHSGNS